MRPSTSSGQTTRTFWSDHAITSGRKNQPNANALLILADGGGSNGARVRAWKWELHEQLVAPFAITVTVCHYPTGASKWKPIEHRLFSQFPTKVAGIGKMRIARRVFPAIDAPHRSV